MVRSLWIAKWNPAVWGEEKRTCPHDLRFWPCWEDISLDLSKALGPLPLIDQELSRQTSIYQSSNFRSNNFFPPKRIELSGDLRKLYLPIFEKHTRDKKVKLSTKRLDETNTSGNLENQESSTPAGTLNRQLEVNAKKKKEKRKIT